MINLACQNNILYPDENREYLERALAATPVFREHSLCLYCGVSARDMLSAEESGQPAPDSGRIPYLICREDEALLSFEWTPGEDAPPPAQVEGLLHLRVTEEQADDAVDFLAWAAEKMLGQANAPAWRYRARPIPSEFRRELERERLIAWGGLSWLPTEYGSDNGIIRAYPGGTDGIPCCEACCSSPAWTRLEALLRRKRTAAPAWERLPFAQRIERLTRGLPSNSAYSMAIIRRFADMPLEDYMRDFPAELEELRKWLPEAVTYRQAAAGVCQMLDSAEEWESGQRLMQSLALPLIRRFRKKAAD